MIDFLPETDLVDLDVEVIHYPTKTFRVVGNRIYGMVDGLLAMEQAVEKILKTERYSSVIYSGAYGVELEDLIGKDLAFVRADLQRRIHEALSEDDRYTGIKNFTIIKRNIHDLEVSFTVETTEGSLDIDELIKI